ncbi:YgfZ/GcvT domain-containing protein [Vreelandella malpeensis]|uniref:Folate-binding protein YgfZ n=1 Tax=Vreelandella malpeensis TaxID=1172368 RepID=A0ABS8DUF6_9GAMM|nr:folate-binding protein [Halomonas malpeensis]MCB8889881.1 folate-binding protein YgfZ [Halomonas malpeensis]
MATDVTPLPSGETRLDLLSALDIKGTGADKFLQGQTSAQVNLADGRFAPLTCFCTPKGRIIANGQLIKVADDHYRLLLSATLVEGLAAHLGKFAAFYRVELDVMEGAVIGASPTAAKARAEALGLALPPNPYLHASDANGNVVLRLPGDERYLFCEREADATSDPALDNAWQLADIRAGLVWLTDAQQDHFLPQMINWEALGGISFKKGCYTGQEVVARAHFRGQVKKRLARAVMTSDDLPDIGETLTDDQGKNLGEVVSSAFAAEGQVELLAVMATKVLETPQPLHLGERLVTLESLPYPIERLDPEKLALELRDVS